MSKHPSPVELLVRGTDDHYQDAALYDFEYEDHRADIAWYRDVVRTYRGDAQEYAVLEMGAGTGRISIPLAKDGATVIAVDRMPTMLERLRVKAGELAPQKIQIIEGDILQLGDRSETLDMVLAPFNVLMHMYTWRDILACFREAARVLKPNGIFAFDVLLPDLDWLTWDEDTRHAVTKFRDPSTGRSMFYSTNHRYDLSTQICHVRIYYDVAPKRGRPDFLRVKPEKIVHLAHRQIFPEELRVLLDLAGFEILSQEGDFIGVPLTQASESQNVVCRKR